PGIKTAPDRGLTWARALHSFAQRRQNRQNQLLFEVPKSQLFSAPHFALRHRLTEGNRRRRAAHLLHVREARGAPCVPRLSLAPLPLDIARLLSAVATVGLGGIVRDDEGRQSRALFPPFPPCFPSSIAAQKSRSLGQKKSII